MLASLVQIRPHSNTAPPQQALWCHPYRAAWTRHVCGDDAAEDKSMRSSAVTLSRTAAPLSAHGDAGPAHNFVLLASVSILRRAILLSFACPQRCRLQHSLALTNCACVQICQDIADAAALRKRIPGYWHQCSQHKSWEQVLRFSVCLLMVVGVHVPRAATHSDGWTCRSRPTKWR